MGQIHLVSKLLLLPATCLASFSFGASGCLFSSSCLEPSFISTSGQDSIILKNKVLRVSQGPSNDFFEPLLLAISLEVFQLFPRHESFPVLFLRLPTIQSSFYCSVPRKIRPVVFHQFREEQLPTNPAFSLPGRYASLFIPPDVSLYDFISKIIYLSYLTLFSQ